MDKLKAKILDFTTFSVIALSSAVLGIGDNMRTAMIINHFIFYSASICAALSLAIRRPGSRRRTNHAG